MFYIWKVFLFRISFKKLNSIIIEHGFTALEFCSKRAKLISCQTKENIE